MRKFTFYWLWLLLLFATVNFYGQNRISYETERKEFVSFTYLDDEFYINYDTSQTLRPIGIVKEVISIYNNTALIKLTKSYSDLSKLKADLNLLYNNVIIDVDITLQYTDGIKHLSQKEILISANNILKIEETLKSLNLTKKYELQKHNLIDNLHILTIDNISTPELFKLVSDLNKETQIKYAEPNLIRLIVPHNDPYLNNQWSIKNNGYMGGTPGADMNVKEAWNIATGTGIKVAILDEGVQLNHPDLAGNLLTGYDATGHGTSGGYSGNDNHGTACAGIVGAISNNIGVRGVAYNSKIIPIRIAFKNPGSNNWVTDANKIASGFLWAKNNGADIISNSWGGGSPSSTINNAINDCVNNGRGGKGCVVLFSSGNSNNSSLPYPASLSNVIAVGASSMCDERKSPSSCDGENWWGSNYGSGLSVVAPGVKIYTTKIGSQYMSDFNGTSSACPNAAGVAALILSVNPNFTKTQVRNILETTADKVGGYNYQTNPSYPNGKWEENTGYGRINAYKAVLKAQCLKTPSTNLDLYIKDCSMDYGQEPSGCVDFWDSPDIWVRNNQDGQLQNQNPIYRLNGAPNYIYVKVRNRSCVASSGNEKLKIYWAKANTSYAWPQYWDGSISNTNGYPLSSGLSPVNIPIIQPGEEAIVTIPWVVPNPANYSNMEEPWHYCLMARIESSNDPMTFPETEDSGANIRNNNNIAQKNVSIVNPSPGNPIGAIVGVGNAFPVHRDFIFEFKVKPSELNKLIYEEAEVTIELDNRLLQTWVEAGRSLINMKQISENTFLITGDNASFGGLHFEPNQIDLLTLRFNFLTAEITDKDQYTYYVIQKDLDGTVIGGETYEIRKEVNRDLFYAEIDGDTEVNKNEPVLLSAKSINEPALYNWYDVEGNLLLEGRDFATSVAAGKNYKLEVIALVDGYKDYSEVELKLKPNAIEVIYPNPASDVLTVNYKINEGGSAYLSITGVYMSNISNNYILYIDQEQITIDISNYPLGAYVITLVTDGNISDSENLIIQ